MDECKLSVIIPVYNGREYIKKCLESVLQQNMEQLEIICINDGSSDDSLNIIQECAECDKRMRIVSYLDNHGVSYARNIGLKMAKGKYVYFLDADDLIIQGAMIELYNLSEEKRTDCILFNSGLLLETRGLGGPKLEFDLHRVDGNILTGSEALEIMMEHDVYTSSVWRQFWRKQYLLDNSNFFPEGFLGEDTLFSFKAYLSANRVAIVNRRYHIYRRHGGTMSTLCSPQKCISLFRTLCKMLEIWMHGVYSEKTDSAIGKRINQVYKLVKRYYVYNKGEVETYLESEREKYLFDMLVKQSKLSSISVRPEILEKIKKFDKVLIYGAALYAMDVTETLLDNNIKVEGYLVTEIQPNTRGAYGIPVYEVGKILVDPKEYLVVLGVAPKNRNEVIETLKNHYFFNYLALD